VPGRRTAIGKAYAHGRAGVGADSNGEQADGVRAGPQDRRLNAGWRGGLIFLAQKTCTV
jgi:hypothetical protein